MQFRNTWARARFSCSIIGFQVRSDPLSYFYPAARIPSLSGRDRWTFPRVQPTLRSRGMRRSQLSGGFLIGPWILGWNVWMAKIKLTKTTVDSAVLAAKEYEVARHHRARFSAECHARGRKIFMVQYRTNAGERRKPAIGRFGDSQSSKHARLLGTGLPTCARVKTQA